MKKFTENTLQKYYVCKNFDRKVTNSKWKFAINNNEQLKKKRLRREEEVEEIRFPGNNNLNLK